jgi:tetratricopeptide (TPR) repeat protein
MTGLDSAGWFKSVMQGVVLAAALLLIAPCSLAELTIDETRQLARGHMQDPSAGLRAAACRTLAEAGTDEDLPRLMGALFDGDADVRAAAEAAVWRIWSRSGDAETDRLFDIGVEQMSRGLFAAAIRTFTQVIDKRPAFAEGWNKRATVYFLMGEDDLSLKDCHEVLKRNPYHFGVLAGFGQIHMRRGELETALDYFERALAANPNMDGVRLAIDAIQRALARRDGRLI